LILGALLNSTTGFASYQLLTKHDSQLLLSRILCEMTPMLRPFNFTLEMVQILLKSSTHNFTFM